MRSPTGARPRAVQWFGELADESRVLTGDHVIEVPLDHEEPGGERIEVYARELRAPDLADTDQPYLLFLQGGPGGRSPRPGADAPTWLGWALRRYRVLLLDQRGTGRSTPQDRHTLTGLTSSAQADRLALFRADAIVADAELLRRHLLRDAPWTVLGQSFGGFCTWTYLSYAPAALTAAYVTGPGADVLARLAEDAWAGPGQLSDTFLGAVVGQVSYASAPLYALIHEACYGEPGVVTGWSAQRVREELGLPAEPVPDPDGEERLPLTGENVFPSSVAADPALAALIEGADLLAHRRWERALYDPARLAANTVPVVACLYTRDMYVDPELSRATAAATGGVTVLEDDARHHDALRRHGSEVLDRLEDVLGTVAPDAVAPVRPTLAEVPA